ncbi:hypothetical protein pmac_cds_617 [Pandoravirus macleodensis]|uniref:Uncharacterized protein n=1 Tax=Pandoravirus macleodensis TaxID=2107707 RepID=A0A2U7UFZ3_9VIRU|nr:hypothetical protein pmac_cds_617 [Pandoravirus macleodensis]AVK77305.1 hypothetical protein pmac_cds_617 [Pandoravirus macleodensis]UMO80054.1 hypothetical protein [Pandoravirus aubagnensis]
MGGRTRRRWRFWRRALGVALCWRRDYEPCESDDGSRISRQSYDDGLLGNGSRISPRCDSAPGSVIDSRDGNRDDTRLAYNKHTADDIGDRHVAIGDKEAPAICWPSSVLKRLATMEQPISVRCAKTGDVVYKVDLVEETLECLRNGRRRSRSLTFFMDRERTDDQRLTLYGLLAPGCEAWTMAFVQDGGDGCRAHVRIESDAGFVA